MSKLAIVFPGQGSQTPEMAGLVAQHRPDLLALAGELTGDEQLARVAESTRFAQPAIYCASIACFEAMGRPAADLYGGHSLGEVAALAAAGAIDDVDGLRIVAERGRLMAEATSAAAPGGMLAVRAPAGEVAQLAATRGVTVANVNDPTQVVLAGTDAALDSVASDLRERGLRSRRLPVAGAFHSPAMEPAVEPFRRFLDGIAFADPCAGVYSGASGAPFGAVRDELAAAITRPVLWLDTVCAMRAAGAIRFLEPGPGQVLSGLVRRSLADAEIVEALEVARA